MSVPRLDGDLLDGRSLFPTALCPGCHIPYHWLGRWLCTLLKTDKPTAAKRSEFCPRGPFVSLVSSFPLLLPLRARLVFSRRRGNSLTDWSASRPSPPCGFRELLCSVLRFGCGLEARLPVQRLASLMRSRRRAAPFTKTSSFWRRGSEGALLIMMIWTR